MSLLVYSSCNGRRGVIEGREAGGRLSLCTRAGKGGHVIGPRLRVVGVLVDSQKVFGK